jgi:hypothetical protein
MNKIKEKKSVIVIFSVLGTILGLQIRNPNKDPEPGDAIPKGSLAQDVQSIWIHMDLDTKH